MEKYASDKKWDRATFAKAERQFHELNSMGSVSCGGAQSALVSEIEKARQHIKSSLEKMDGGISSAAGTSDLVKRLTAIEQENKELKSLVKKLNDLCLDSQKRIAALESAVSGGKAAAAPAKSAPAPAANKADDDDDVDLFGSDSEEESEEAARIREERLAAYKAKKSNKPALIAKSSLVLDIKPWDDETDLNQMEAEIRKITADGLLWGASKFVPVAFGIKKLSISCVVEDEKISIDWLSEEIEKFEDFVQSVDVAAFNKI